MIRRRKESSSKNFIMFTKVVIVDLLMIFIATFSILTTTSATEITSSEPYGNFDIDTRDDCISNIVHCQSDIYGHIFVQCSKTCTEYLQESGGGGNMVGTVDDGMEEEFYNLPSMRLANGSINKLNMERFEGSVTLISVVPLLPGMAAYYYEMFVHLYESFHPYVECIIIPIDLGSGIHIKETQKLDKTKPGSRVWIVEEETNILSNKLVKFLLHVKPRNGSGTTDEVTGEVRQVELDTDRVTTYILSADATFVERFVSPSLQQLQDKVRTYLKTIDYQDL